MTSLKCQQPIKNKYPQDNSLHTTKALCYQLPQKHYTIESHIKPLPKEEKARDLTGNNSEIDLGTPYVKIKLEIHTLFIWDYVSFQAAQSSNSPFNQSSPRKGDYTN
jgi:hypothetical protein